MSPFCRKEVFMPKFIRLLIESMIELAAHVIVMIVVPYIWRWARRLIARVRHRYPHGFSVG